MCIGQINKILSALKSNLGPSGHSMLWGKCSSNLVKLCMGVSVSVCVWKAGSPHSGLTIMLKLVWLIFHPTFCFVLGEYIIHRFTEWHRRRTLNMCYDCVTKLSFIHLETSQICRLSDPTRTFHSHKMLCDRQLGNHTNTIFLRPLVLNSDLQSFLTNVRSYHSI